MLPLVHSLHHFAAVQLKSKGQLCTLQQTETQCNVNPHTSFKSGPTLGNPLHQITNVMWSAAAGTANKNLRRNQRADTDTLMHSRPRHLTGQQQDIFHQNKSSQYLRAADNGAPCEAHLWLAQERGDGALDGLGRLRLRQRGRDHRCCANPGTRYCWRAELVHTHHTCHRAMLFVNGGAKLRKQSFICTSEAINAVDLMSDPSWQITAMAKPTWHN